MMNRRAIANDSRPEYVPAIGHQGLGQPLTIAAELRSQLAAYEAEGMSPAHFGR